MRVMLHGAINMSNYGDYLFAELFGNAIKKFGAEVEYYAHPKYGVSDYFAKYLDYIPDRTHYKKVMEKCDALVMISGGYFIEPLRKRPFAEFRRIQRYLAPAYYFLNAGKPIYILGVGAGPFTKAAFSRKSKKILEYAKVLTVRNEESKHFCREYGIKRDIEVTADTALLLKEYMESEKSNVKPFVIPLGRKMLLFHIDPQNDVKEKMREIIIPAVKRFLDNNPDYQLYLAADGVCSNEVYGEFADMFEGYLPEILKFDDPWVFTRQLECADIIVTTKLHAGIVGSLFGRSVLSFPFVPNKTTRFYKQIGESGRCKALSEVGSAEAYSMLESYKGKGITVPAELIDRARINFAYLPH